MTLYYLGIPVELTDELNVEGRSANSFSPAHVNARWPNQKIYTHYRAQLLETPYGR